MCAGLVVEVEFHNATIHDLLGATVDVGQFGIKQLREFLGDLNGPKSVSEALFHNNEYIWLTIIGDDSREYVFDLNVGDEAASLTLEKDGSEEPVRHLMPGNGYQYQGFRVFVRKSE